MGGGPLPLSPHEQGLMVGSAFVLLFGVNGLWAFRKPERFQRFWGFLQTQVDFVSFWQMSFLPPSWRIRWTRGCGLAFAIGAAVWLIAMWWHALGAA